MSQDSGRGRYANPEGSATWEYLSTMSCAFLIFSISCVPGWDSPTLAILMGGETADALNPSDASTLSSMATLGGAVAPALTMVMADKLGRKNSLLAIGIPTIISWGLITITQHITVLFVARFIGGLSLGLIVCVSPMYLGEIASVKLRGAIGMVCGTMLNAGILFMFVMVPYLSVRRTAFVCLSIATTAVFGVWFIPESPYFLVMVGKIDQAEAALEKLRGKTNVAEELELIKITNRKEDTVVTEDGNEEENEGSSAFKQLFTVPGNRKALCINMLLIIVFQFGSYITIIVYGQIIFEKMKSGVSAHVCTMIIATLQFICNILTAFVIDKLGRRPLICISGVISGICLLAVAVYFYLMEYTKMDVTPYAMYAVSAVFLNIVALNIGLTPLQMVIQGEILDTRIKGLALCIIGMSSGVFATIATKLYLMLAETWSYGHSLPFFIFVAVTWICTAFILKLLPETKGKTLLEIQRDLNAR